MEPSVKQRLFLSVVPRIASTYIRLLRLTMKLEYLPPRRLPVELDQFILAFWHSRFMMMPYWYTGSRMTVMVSRHRDAEMLVRTLRPFGYEFARGSTTRGGPAALRDLLRRTREGSDAGIAPDGPKGPRRRVQPGIIAVARMSGLPILPVTFSAARARRVRTWDCTVVPRPFSKGLYLCAEPIVVPRDAGRDEQERLRVALEETLDRITDEVDRATGLGPEDPRPPVSAS